MGIRYRKSIKVAPGVKINLNRKSASVTVGGKGYHKTFNSNGQTTTSINLPVKGLSYTDRKGKKSNSSSAPAARYENTGSVVEAPAPKEKKITAKAVIPAPPTAGVAVLGSLIIVAGFFLSKIVDFSEFVIIKGDDPKKDYERYSALIAESQK